MVEIEREINHLGGLKKLRSTGQRSAKIPLDQRLIILCRDGNPDAREFCVKLRIEHLADDDGRAMLNVQSRATRGCVRGVACQNGHGASGS